jgi:ADP-heptose:LPS heptosyltransferase
MRKAYELSGGLGDVIACMGIFQKEKIENPGIETCCYLSLHGEGGSNLIEKNPYIDEIIVMPTWSAADNISQVNDDRARGDRDFAGKNPYCLNEIANPAFFITEPDKVAANEILANFDGKKIIIIHKYQSKWADDAKHRRSKEIPEEFWASIIERLLSIGNYGIIIVGGERDASIHSHVYENSSVINLVGKTTARQTSVLVNSASLVIAIDSFIKSLSLALSVPTILLLNGERDDVRDTNFLTPYYESPFHAFLDVTAVSPKEVVLQALDCISCREKLREVDISIIMTSYNKAKWIKRGIESILAQDLGYLSIEIIIIDDNSIDNIDKIVNSFDFSANVQIRFYKSSCLRRVGNSARHRNAAVKLAKGKYILLTDPEIIHTGNSIFEGYKKIKDKFRFIVSCPLYSLYPETQSKIDSYSLKDDIGTLMSISHPNAFFPTFHYFLMLRNDYIWLGGLNELFVDWGYEDTDFLIRTELAGFKWRLITDFVLFHQNHNGNCPTAAGGDDSLNSSLSQDYILQHGIFANVGQEWGKL